MAVRQYIRTVSEPEGIDVRELGENASPAEESRSVYQQMVDAGQVRPATGDLRRHLRENPPLRAEPGERALSEVLQEMRDEERY